jgi:hypothetical protein
MNWIKKNLKDFIIIVGISALLLSIILLIFGNKLFKSPKDKNPETFYRVQNNYYHHTLAPNYDGYGIWGGKNYKVCTDSFGFKANCNDPIQNSKSNFDIIFIGDSFTEGVGLPYEETFVGIIANTEPKIRVANMGVSSYSPSIYYSKIKKFLDDGLVFKEVIVYIDISDVHDEAIGYILGSDGVTKSMPLPESTFRIEPVEKSYVQLIFGRITLLKQQFVEFFTTKTKHPRDYPRAHWTYSQNSEGYGEMGIEGGIEKSLKIMNQLYELLNKNGIKLSIAVYPWPAQILFDKQDSRQVEIWQNFCLTRCANFINSFPSFFLISEKFGKEYVLDNFYIKDDDHFNLNGSRLVAKDFFNTYKKN